jgi:YidC/Oxa1 family membrane protein insertase
LPEIQNPNLQSQGPSGGGSGGDMRSFMSLMLLMLAVLLGYQYFFMKPKPEQQPSNSQTQSQPAAQSAPGQSQSAAAASAPAAAAPQVSAALETDTTVENELYKIVFTNRGAQVKSWILKKYFDSTGKPLDMVQQQAASKFGFPFSLFTYDSGLTSQLNNALYQVNVAGTQPSATGLVLAPTSITFHYAANGIDAIKTFKFDSSYVVSVQAEVKQNGSPVRALVAWPAGLGDMEEFRSSMSGGFIATQTRTPSYFAWSLNGKESSQLAPKVSGNNTLDRPYDYAAVMDLYFASVFLPDAPDRTTVVTLHNSIELPSNPSDPSSKLTPADVLGLAVGDTSGTTSLRFFAGPKATELLASIHATGPNGKPDGPSIEPLIEFGFWTFIAKPLYFILRFMVSHGIPNWGWAIVVFTLVFTVVLLPSRIWMTRSSLKMMRIQPKVDAIKKRYAHLKMNDPKRQDMNTEMMALYKTENVNMYGGCLPMLLQMPLFFAYYRMLANAVELRQAHWLWLPDLSQPDPTHVLPIIIILTMFLTQYITPSPGMDPAQRRMMAIMMPVFMGFVLWHYASGLALYWCTSNILYLIMQIVINQSSMGKEMHAIAARRAIKRK